MLCLLLALRVKVDAAHSPGYLVKAYIVEPLEACAGDRPNTMIWYQEILLPPHEDILPLREILVVEVCLLRLFSQGTPRRKSRPVLHVRLLGCAPGFVLRLESMFGANDLAFEVGGESRMIFRQACMKTRSQWIIVGTDVDFHN